LRNTARARFWLKALTRNRANLGISNEKSVSKNSSKALRCLSFMMSYTMLCTSLCTSAGILTRFNVAVHPNHRRYSRRTGAVRGIVLHRKGEKLRDINAIYGS